MSTAIARIAAVCVGCLGLSACAGDIEEDKTTRGDQPAGVQMRDDTLSVEALTKDLDQPTSLAFVEDQILVTEKTTGKVRIVRDGELTGDAIDLAVNGFDERGLLGIALHPDFSAKPFVYLHWTWNGEGTGPEKLLGEDTDEEQAVPALGNRIDRFKWANDKLTFDRNIVEFPSNTLESDTSGRVRGNHDAGPLAFGPDGKLYTMMGDQNLRGQLQNLPGGPPPDDAHFAGVILRLNDDGTTPPDNPFFAVGGEMGGEVGENVQKIYVYGVRNSFGLAFEPDSGSLWQTENGDDTYDEVNVFSGGANSGWIQIQGPPAGFEEYKRLEIESEDGLDVPSFPPTDLAESSDAAQSALFALPGSKYAAPVLSYERPPALTAIGFVGDDRLGKSSHRTVWMGTVLTDSLLRYPLSPDGRSLSLTGGLTDRIDNNEEKGDLGESEPFVVGTGFGVVTAIHQGPDGDLYVLSLDSGTIYRIYAGGSDGGGSANSGTSEAEGPSASREPAEAVAVRDDLFEPEEVEVAAGETVEWNWEGNNPHNVSSDDFKSKIQTEGTFRHKFEDPGTYDYICTVHPSMVGSVTVTDQ